MATVYFQRLPAGQKASTAAHRLLERVLGTPWTALEYHESGKPWLPGGPEFSISHTGAAVAVAIDESPVGVDVESLRPILNRLPERVLSQTEMTWFTERGREPGDFFTLWTLKESYYKALGTGLPGFPNETSFFLERGMWKLSGEPWNFFVWEKNLLRIALCSYAQQVELIEVNESLD